MVETERSTNVKNNYTFKYRYYRSVLTGLKYI